MQQKTINSFSDGMNTDVSDYVLKNTQLRIAQNMRIIDLDGSSYILTNLKGTSAQFTLTAGFKPVAAQEFNSVLYIISHNEVNHQIELGSYPSPDYSGGAGSMYQYRPLNNFNGGPFRTDLFHGQSIPPIIQKLEIQPDYDESVNLCFTIKGFRPRIVNSKFKVIPNPFALSVIPDRVGASSNSYTTSSVSEETSLVLYSDTVIRPTFNSISSGGKLKPGNYSYVFLYMTDDFNTTDVINQSGTFQVAFGDDVNTRKGGNLNQETNRRIIMDLATVDTDFAYLKVYCLYSSGTEGVEQQLLEFTKPIQITGENMQFVHTGYEELAEVSRDTINLEYSVIGSAAASAQVNGYYFLGNIKAPAPNYTSFKTFAASLVPGFNTKSLGLGTLPGYANPENVYKFMGHFGNEAYPYGIVFRMTGGYNSPVFPIQGGIFTGFESSGTYGSIFAPSGPSDPAGVVRFPSSKFFPPFKGNNIFAKHLYFNMSTVPDDIKQQSIGFFFVRGERRSDLLTQGLLIPTMKAPVIEDYTTDLNKDTSYYFRNRTSINDQLFFKHLPYLDNLMEAYDRWTRSGSGSTEVPVINGSGAVQAWMPAFVNDPKNITSDRPEIFYTDPAQTFAQHWALLSGDAMCNEPYFNSVLNIDQGAIEQIGKVGFRVYGEIKPRHNNGVIDVTQVKTGYHYLQETIDQYFSSSALARITSSRFVPGETLATGNDFLSKFATVLYMREFSGNNYEYYLFRQAFNSYFGIKMLDRLVDDTKGVSNPVSGNLRARASAGSYIPAAGISTGSDDNYGSECSVSRYNNLNTLVKGAFLVNVYRANTLASLVQLYPNIDSVVYKQVTGFYNWNDVISTPQIDVFGGDCYITQAHRRMYQNGERNPLRIETETLDRSNIDMGQLVSWWQESKYNVHLREPKEFDASELEDRSFFPYATRGDFQGYRKVRYPETVEHSQGYSELLAAKSFIAPASLAPVIESNFFSRIQHSARHVPNAFKNGYRSMVGSKYRDYDSAMGQIVALFNHHNMLFIVFEHGLASTTIERGVATGSDQAGAVFIESSEVLPPTLTYHSREIGCQASDFHSLVQTPSGIYGYDRERDKIWQMREELAVISDASVSSFLKNNPSVNPRSGFDPEFNEVIFTSDNWTLCFKEGLERFTSFYSFKPDFYARRQKDFFSFLSNQAHIHNQLVYAIYDEEQTSFIDVVVNVSVAQAKVLDFIEIISNEVPPDSVEFYSYNNQTARTLLIDSGSLNQYSVALNEIDVITEEPVIKYRDKRYFVQVPVRSIYTAAQEDDEWEDNGRIRDKYIILRLTYNSTLALQLASVVSTYRISHS